jgi:diguanylate cyclase (GGDEF)-like protein/putative nucleotidyltransferase with HDIG domain
MRRFSRLTLAWVGMMVVAAIAATTISLLSTSATRGDWLILAVLALCGAIANIYPITSAFGGASYRLTNVSVIAGAIILPPGLVALLPLLAITPELWVHRDRPRERLIVGWSFNVSATTISALVASLLIHRFDGYALSDLRDLLVLLVAVTLFTLVSALLVGVVIALHSRIPLPRVDTFTGPALLSNGLIGVLGVAVAGMWLSKPVLLFLVPVFLIIAYRLTRNAHLAHMAEVDAKTGLHNSRHFERALQEELAHSHRLRRPLALLFADLDHFKRVNDQHGHAVGDLVLREISKLLTSLLRKGDVVARFGGEEFVILLPGTDTDEAVFLAERVRSAVESCEIPLKDGATLRCTVSVGVAGYPDHGKEFSDLIRLADEAMYQAKRTRNAVARAGEPHAVPRLSTPQATPPTSAAPVSPAAAIPHAVQHVAPVSDVSAIASPAATVARISRLVPFVLWGTVMGGCAAVAWSGFEVHQAARWLAILPLCLLAAGAELVKVRVYEADRQQRMSFSFTIAVAMGAVTIEPLGAPLVTLVAALVQVVVVLRQRNLQKALFNIANLPLAAAMASGAYLLVTSLSPTFDTWHLAAALAALVAFDATNFGLISVMISLHSRRPLLSVLRDSAWHSPTKLFLGLTGAFVGGAYTQLGLVGAIMFAVPLLILRYSLALYAKKSEQTITTLMAAKAEVEEAHTEKEEMLRKLIETVALIIDARDNSVSGHSRRVAKFAVAIGKELSMSTADLAVLHTAGLFHDLGKVGIPESILHKPAKLTADEYTIIKEHAALGQRILSEVPQLADIARMVGEHHERYDGFGYPLGLAAETISLGGRILVVADALETMLADRPYSRARELHLALAELDRCAGSHFDPSVVGAVHRAVTVHGADFFGSAERLADRDWAAADQILAQVFA